jgi:hypothetical protein
VGEVLAHAALLLEEFHHRRCYGCRFGIELELSVDFAHQRSGRLQQRQPGPEAIAGVGPQVSFHPRMGRFEKKLHGFENRGIGSLSFHPLSLEALDLLP